MFVDGREGNSVAMRIGHEAAGRPGTGAELDGALREPPDPANRWAVPAWLDRICGWLWRLGLVAVSVYLLLRAFGALRLVTVPVLFALVIAALLWPLRRALTDRRCPDLVATWIVVVLAFGLISGVIWLASVGIRDQLMESTNWNQTKVEIERWLITGPLDLSAEDVVALEKRVGDFVTTGLLTVDGDRARLAANLIGATFLAAVLLFFFVKDGPQMWGYGLQRAAPHRRQAIDAAGQAAFRALSGYARAVALTGVVDALAVGLVLFVLGVPLAIPLALLTFFAAFVPIVGATVAGALSTVVALVTVGPEAAVIVVVATLVIQQVEGNVVMPLVMRTQVKLHPAVVLIVLAMGGAMAGLMGAFVAVPLAAMTTAAAQQLRRPTNFAPEQPIRVSRPDRDAASA